MERKKESRRKMEQEIIGFLQKKQERIGVRYDFVKETISIGEGKVSMVLTGVNKEKGVCFLIESKGTMQYSECSWEDRLKLEQRKIEEMLKENGYLEEIYTWKDVAMHKNQRVCEQLIRNESLQEKEREELLLEKSLIMMIEEAVKKREYMIQANEVLGGRTNFFIRKKWGLGVFEGDYVIRSKMNFQNRMRYRKSEGVTYNKERFEYINQIEGKLGKEMREKVYSDQEKLGILLNYIFLFELTDVSEKLEFTNVIEIEKYFSHQKTKEIVEILIKDTKLRYMAQKLGENTKKLNKRWDKRVSESEMGIQR